MRTLLIALFIIGSLALSSISADAAPADPLASQATRDLLTYFQSFPSRTNQRLVSGQWGHISSHNLTSQNIFNATGQWPGLVGEMYYQFTSGVSRISEVNAALMPQAQLGAIPEIAGNFGNPDGGGNIDVPLASCPNVYTDNGNAANLAYKASMNLAAAGLQEFENANIPVLFRPLHEMNGNWHWWGPTECTDAQFKLLWQYTFTYLTTTKGLHNLLWVYSVSQGMGNYTGRYPGAGYVDIVGSDIYGYVSGDVSSYAPLVALGHPYAITELGLQTKETDPPRDLNAAIQQFKANMPLAVYFMNWANGWAIQNQVNASPALNDPWVQNRRTPRPADTQPPAAPTGLLVN